MSSLVVISFITHSDSLPQPLTFEHRFGPKNAPATQTQYLYIFSSNAAASGSGPVQLASLNPSRGCVLTVTQFDGIPMADVFKVMHYWTFELDGAKTMMRIGVAVHFIKNSMLKSQISSGVRDELGVLSRRWCLFAEARVVHAGQAPKRRSIGGETPVPRTVDPETAVRNSRRFSLKQLADAGIVSEIHGDGSTAPPTAPPTDDSFFGRLISLSNAATETHLVAAILFLLIILILQFFYNRSLLAQVQMAGTALSALKESLAVQKEMHEKLKHLLDKQMQ